MAQLTSNGRAHEKEKFHFISFLEVYHLETVIMVPLNTTMDLIIQSESYSGMNTDNIYHLYVTTIP